MKTPKQQERLKALTGQQVAPDYQHVVFKRQGLYWTFRLGSRFHHLKLRHECNHSLGALETGGEAEHFLPLEFTPCGLCVDSRKVLLGMNISSRRAQFLFLRRIKNECPYRNHPSKQQKERN